MSTVTRTLVLTGGRAGWSCQCGKFQFINGKLRLSGAINHVESLTKYIGRAYKAFPEGSNELAHYQAIDADRLRKQQEAKHGLVPIHPANGSQRLDSVPGGDGPDGPGPTAIPTLVIRSTNDPDEGGAERVPNGDGLSDAGDDQKLTAAVAALDAANDDHWTQDGRPAVHAVATLSGLANTTRAMIDSVAQDVRRPR